MFLRVVSWDLCFFFFFIITDLPPLLENTFIGYANDSILVASVSSPRKRLVVAASTNRDLTLINA